MGGWRHVWAAIFMTVVVLSNTASADTFPVRKYEDGTIAIVSNHTQITGSRTAIRGDLWLSKMNGKGGYLMGTIANTRTLNDTLVSIKAQLRPVKICVENNTKLALFNFTTNEYFECICKAGWMGQDCAMPLPDIEEALFRIDASDFTNAAATWLPMSGQTMLKSSGQIESAEYEGRKCVQFNADEDYIEWDLNIGPTAMPILTLAVDVYVSSTPNNLGWLFGDENGGCDRYILLHDNRVGSNRTGASCKSMSQWDSPPVKVKAWNSIVAFYNQTAQTSYIYVNGEKSKVLSANHDEGNGKLRLGSPWGGHTTDSCVAKALVYDFEFTSEQVIAFSLESDFPPPPHDYCAGSSHRYWRLRLTEQKYAYNIKEIQFFSDIGRYDDTQSTIAEPWSGSNSLHVEDNCILPVSGGQYGSHGCDRAFDNNIDAWWSNWASGDNEITWIGMDFKTPQKVSHVRFMNGRNHAGEQGLVMVVEFSDDKSTWTEWTGERIVTQPKEQSQTSTSRTNTWQEAISKCSAPNRNPSYTHYPKECVGGHNIVKFTGKTVEQCKEICSAMSNCDAFEFGVAYGGAGGYQAGDCQPQSSANRGSCSGSYYNLDLYVKNEVVNININGKELHQDSDGWILLLAYKHVGGENKALVQGTAPTSPTEGYSHVWLNDLGLTAADVDSVRFYCHTSGHGRKVHFSTSDATIKSFLIDGSATGNKVSLWTSGTNKFSDHTANLPDATTHTYTTLTNHPFFKGGTYHWIIKGSASRFECDDYPGGYAESTLHQIWFKRKQ